MQEPYRLQKSFTYSLNTSCRIVRFQKMQYLLSTGQLSNTSECLIWSFIRKGGWKHFTGFNVESDSVDHRPVNTTSDGRVELADATQRQINLDGLLMKCSCEKNNRIRTKIENETLESF